MNFTPKSEEEINRERMLPAGIYPFTIIGARERVSKAGTPMLEVKLNVHSDNGDFHIYDYVSPEFLPHKLRHLCYQVNKGNDYEQGNLIAETFIGLQGYCKVGIQEAKNGYPERNSVVDYGRKDKSQSNQESIESKAAKIAALAQAQAKAFADTHKLQSNNPSEQGQVAPESSEPDNMDDVPF